MASYVAKHCHGESSEALLRYQEQEKEKLVHHCLRKQNSKLFLVVLTLIIKFVWMLFVRDHLSSPAGIGTL